MQLLKEFKLLNWNVAGAKFLEESPTKREKYKKRLNDELRKLIAEYKPDVITLQEIVQYGKDSKHYEDIIDKNADYSFHPFRLIDTDSLSVRAKWNKLEKNGKNWPKGTFFAQGNGFLFLKDLPHQPVWDLPQEGNHKPRLKRLNYVEKVSLESGLYFGDRDTEPRAALVAHFVYKPRGKPLDIFVINLHLTTLTNEREGIPVIDRMATEIRLAQLDIIFNGIVSRYNSWKRGKFRERGESRIPEDWESFDRREPVWILTGDFNFTPESHEYDLVQDLNFMDMITLNLKGEGTKASGTGKKATLVLDYIFAGPKYISLAKGFTEASIVNNKVCDVKVSDHFPMIATIPIWR
jgi:endonuclease/exonuclease/phosphatase family metal-dependent hydrolase